MPRQTRKRALSRIHAAIQDALGHAYNADPAGAGGGGGGNPPVDPPKKPDEPKKLELTEEELQSRIKSALDDQQKKADQKAQKEREDAERKAAEEQGKFKELADKERAEKERLAAENRTLRVSSALRDHLAEKHPEYVGTAKYILPLVPADADGDELAKAIESAAEQYVKDNPRQPKSGGGGAQPATQRVAGRGIAQSPQNNDRPARRFSTLNYRA